MWWWWWVYRIFFSHGPGKCSATRPLEEAPALSTPPSTRCGGGSGGINENNKGGGVFFSRGPGKDGQVGGPLEKFGDGRWALPPPPGLLVALCDCTAHSALKPALPVRYFPKAASSYFYC